MKKNLRFCSDIGHFKHDDNLFTYILNKKYNIIIDVVNPELAIINERKYSSAVNVRYSGEVDMRMFGCNYCICPMYLEDDKYIRMNIHQVHIYEMIRLGYATWDTFFKKKDFTKEILNEKPKFACFMYLHDSVPRDTFFTKLSKYKSIDAPGQKFNNVPKLKYDSSYGLYNTGHLFSQEKREFIKPYKFVFAFDSYYPKEAAQGIVGQSTEKIVDPYITNNIPIYWGNPHVSDYFNTKSMINFYDYTDEYYNESALDGLMQEVIDIDNDDDRYINILNENAVDEKEWNNQIDKYLAIFEKIIGF